MADSPEQPSGLVVRQDGAIATQRNNRPLKRNTMKDHLPVALHDFFALSPQTST